MKFFSFEIKRGEPLDKSEEEKPVNLPNPGHLKEGVSPIIACIGTPEQFREDWASVKEIFPDSSSDQNTNQNINYYEEPDKLNKQKFKNAGRYTYVMSSVDSSNKFSESFMNCTGIIVSGLDKEAGKEISFLSHQDPDYFLEGEKANTNFIRDLRAQLIELRGRCVDGTIDAVIVGGNYFRDRPYFQENYLKSIKLISKEVKNILGFEPVVMTGPKINIGGGKDNVFYDNDHRRLYIMRPEVAKESTKSYLPSDIENQEKKW